MKQIPSLDDIKPGQDIGIEIDESKSIDMFLKNLYKSKSVMFQEIYSNELTAAMKARERGAKPWIDVITNLDERKLIIHGYNSLGITPKIMIDVAMVLGASGNTDRDKPGMFGFGFAAFLGISNTMILSSLPMETKKQYDLIFVGSLDSKSIDSVDLEHTGTRIQLTVMPNVDMSDLIRHLVKCVQFSDVPTFLINEVPLEGDLEGYESAGRHEIHSTTHLDHINNVANNANSSGCDEKLWAIIKIKEKAFEFTGLYNPGNSSIPNDGESHKILTLNIPIGAEIPLPNEIRASVLNITDATKLKPTPDRERLDDAAQKAINKRLPKLIEAELQKFNITCLQDFVDAPYENLYENVTDENTVFPWYDKTTENLSVHLLRRVCFWHEKNLYYDSKWARVNELLTGEKTNGKKIPIVILPKYSASEKNAKKCGPERKDFNESEKKQHAWFDRVQNVYPENIIISLPIKIYEFVRNRGYSEKDVIIAADKIPRE